MQFLHALASEWNLLSRIQFPNGRLPFHELEQRRDLGIQLLIDTFNNVNVRQFAIGFYREGNFHIAVSVAIGILAQVLGYKLKH